jgi:hypothetical protein
MQEDVSNQLAAVVYNTSISMIASGVYSTNPIKGIPYLLSKFKKGRKSSKK